MKRTDTILTNPAATMSPRIAHNSRQDEESQDPRRSAAAAAATIEPNADNASISYADSREQALGLRTQNTSTAQIEAEKIARMKELLKKGDAEVPKRS